MEVKIGLGLSTGMFYHAPKGTALPTYPSETLASAWKKVGDVTDAGITLGQSKSVTNVKNWALQIKRSILTEHIETVQSPLLDTTEETLKTTLGTENVTVTPAGAGHGKTIKCNLSADDLPAPEAYLWLMKDGDDMIMIGCSEGQITAVENINFAPTGAINWVPTITAQGSGGMALIVEEDSSSS